MKHEVRVREKYDGKKKNGTKGSGGKERGGCRGGYQTNGKAEIFVRV